MARISVSDFIGVGGIVLAIVLLVLDKAGKLKGGWLYGLLVVACVMTLFVAVGNSWVLDGGKWAIWRGALMICAVLFTYSGIAIWIYAPSSVGPGSPLGIIDPTNPARRFWSVESAKKEDGSLIANYWEHRVEIQNNGPRTLRNVGVTVERTGIMPEMPQDALFVRGKQNMRDLKPGCRDYVPVIRWPFVKTQEGMLAGESAWGYGPVVITASADDVSPNIKTFDFNYLKDQMLFERDK